MHEFPARPATGARLIARLELAADGNAVYRVSVVTPRGEWEGRATVRDRDGAIGFRDEPPGAVTPWLGQLHALLRSAWQRKRSGEPWPRRLTRWRPAPDGTEPA